MTTKILLVLILLATTYGISSAVTNTALPRSTPAQEGVDPNAVRVFVDSLMKVPETDIHHVMVVRHGKVIAEAHPAPFIKDDVHTLYSCSKTFTMLAIGMLIDEGYYEGSAADALAKILKIEDVYVDIDDEDIVVCFDTGTDDGFMKGFVHVELFGELFEITGWVT